MFGQHGLLMGGGVSGLFYIGRSAFSGRSSSITFSNASIGFAAPNRTLIIGVTGLHNDSGSRSISSVSVGGASTTLVIASSATSYPALSGLFMKPLSSGETADIDLNLSGNVENATADVFAYYGGILAVDDTDTSTLTSNSTSVSGSVDVPQGGFVIALSAVQQAFNSYTATFTGATENNDNTTGLGYGGAAIASEFDLDAETGRNINSTWSGNNRRRSICIVSFY